MAIFALIILSILLVWLPIPLEIKTFLNIALFIGMIVSAVVSFKNRKDKY